ncbi:hypothetical protein [Cellulophaga sp. BC115SP]|uniref:hypothetical protein n=1 Tax=Cellulophaga sp. BC115SP TaxID=2683263 RepID=UPI001411FEAE|nr:hypothetical protein [Cellulophaga sp. BC115SP]NBB27006.1 hypothetical protein [Cellulophaga sp. BC115SP]
METTVNQRIDALIKALGFDSVRKFDKAMEIAPGYTANIVGARLSNPSFPFLQKIAIKFPQVDLQWLLTGSGEMFTSEKLSREYVDELEHRLKETTEQANIYKFSVQQVMARQQAKAANFKIVSNKKPVSQRIGIIILFIADSIADRNYSTTVIA